MELTIKFRGIDLDCEFDVVSGDSTVGLNATVEVYHAYYGGCDVWDVIVACGLGSVLDELIGDELEKL